MITACLSSTAIGGDSLVTVAEASTYKRTASLAEVNVFLDTLAARSAAVRLSSLGVTTEGREIPLAVIADPPVGHPAPNDARLTVLLFGSIHAGEICGKEALLMLARELADENNPAHALLDDLIVCLVPVYNADGNEKIAPDNRPGQNGPAEMGARANAMGLDLNRDWIKMEAPETRSFVRFLNTWDPAVIVDTHTTNGSHHRYTLTYQGPKHPAGDPLVIEYTRDHMLPAIDAAFEAETGLHTFFYGNFVEKHTMWRTYPAGPRFGVAYRGLRNRLSILSEAHAYATFEDRVIATRAFCMETLRYAAKHKQRIRPLLRDADVRTIRAGREGAPVALRTRVEIFEQPVDVLGFVEYDDEGNRVEPGEPIVYRIPFENRFVATESIDRPLAYIMPPELADIADRLRRHGVAVEILHHPVVTETEAYKINAIERSDRPFEGHKIITRVGVSTGSDRLTLDAGSFVVRTDQPLGTLAAYLLEPGSSDGLVAWNALDPWLKVDGKYPVRRVDEAGWADLAPAISVEHGASPAKTIPAGPSLTRAKKNRGGQT